jgi:16S rRNA U516 pseudouridylate synthase RsuA-like enzyme
MKKQFEELRFQPKNQILAARFTEREAREIRIFCKKHGLHLSSIIRNAFKEITSTIKE